MKTALTLALLFGLGSLPVFAEENEQVDHELPLVKEGVLGTVNVLRELDVKTGKNRVTVNNGIKIRPLAPLRVIHSGCRTRFGASQNRFWRSLGRPLVGRKPLS